MQLFKYLYLNNAITHRKKKQMNEGSISFPSTTIVSRI